ncbi:sensor histidine kinase [Poseidonocella sedimentorum]|uniref:histidine kinase n=1 Tax=Poseidonocella sedimentorum TaxID=871652 RepID=A0A1I6CWS4_9RHOB|nr:sensor histidine kinase [Poseidonocella sedimentorum]SFQ97648.1 hypothetical protein SAMN04515673_101506 [Poseidonocella sedimentorum]
MTILNSLVAIALIYVVLLFLIAFVAERLAVRGRGRWLRSPLVYTLSLSVYCTAWTFYGAVGYAARSGLEFLTIYLGPTLVLAGWWWGLRKLVRIGRSQRITSIADLISSRFGKSNALAVIVTLMAVIGTTPYIALQLQSVTLAVSVFTGGIMAGADPRGAPDAQSVAAMVALGLALFTILFGTRNLDANERHHGVVIAIAVEAVVKLAALIAVGVFVVWELSGGIGPTLARIEASPISEWNVSPGRWMGLTFVAAAAFICLPRMFQVMVVENADERHLAVAGWAFPLYMLAMSLFVVPITVVGLDLLPAGANPDLFVLTLPLSQGRDGLAFFAFIGGFSAATSMVIVAAIALSTMVSNHIVMPIWLRFQGEGASVSGDVRHMVLLARRISIAGVVFLGYLYFRLSGGGSALAAIGLISFVGVSQFLPALIGGLFWHGATRAGAIAGLLVGFFLWVYTLLLPSLASDAQFVAGLLDQGPLGQGWLDPQALFGISGLDPLVHALVWALTLNALVFVLVSLVTTPDPIERLQGAQFVRVFDRSANAPGWSRSAAESEDLLIMAQRIIGPQEAQRLFQAESARQGLQGYLPDTTPEFINRLERELSGSVGAATAHAMIAQIVGRASVSVEDLMAVADESAQMKEHSTQLEAKSEELARTARQLRRANDKLTELSRQKDAFLSQISHELRTPMTSIRAFSEILRDGDGDPGQTGKFAGVIHDESQRLTRLLDDLLDLSVLENGQVTLNLRDGRLGQVLDHAQGAATAMGDDLRVRRERAREDVALHTDLDRLSQVFINLIANARKYCAAPRPELRIDVHTEGDAVVIDFIDNGAGIPADKQNVIFEKFARVGSDQAAGGAGLGLAICREIMTRLGGSVSYLPGQEGAAFRVILPLRAQMAAQ